MRGSRYTRKAFTNLANLAAPDILNLPEYAATELQQRYYAVLNWLNQNPDWLLILDNADTKESAIAVEKLYAKLSKGHVLITSRRTNWSPQVRQLPLEVLTEKAATAFLLERTQDKRRKLADDEMLAGQIAKDLGYLALALEQAGAYIYTGHLTLARYRQQWEARRREVLVWYDEQLMQYPLSVAATWQTSFDQLSENARLLLN